MNDYVPTTTQVRDFWASDGQAQPAAKSYDYETSATEFDRWLNEERARIWDEAINEASEQGTIQIPDNPYRKATP